MKKFITTYKWVSLPVLLCSAAVVSTATFATPTATQQYHDAKQTSRVAHEYVGGNTQIGAGITDQGNVDINVNQVLFEGQDSSTSGGLWAGFDAVGDDKGFEGGGGELNHNWVSRYDNGEASHVNKAKIAYDQNEAGHDRVTLGYGQETKDLFWEGRVSKGLSGRKDTRDTADGKISDRGYEYGVGGSVGTFLPDSNLRIRGGLDHEWSSKVGNGESDAKNTTLSAGFDKFFDGTGHSVSLDVSGSKRSGGHDNGSSSDGDYSARLGYKYDFAGSSAFQNATTSRRIRVEVPGYTTPPRTQLQTQYKKVPTYKTVPVYVKKVIKVPYKRMVKSTMALEGQTFFKLNSAKLIPSAQKRLTEVANQIKKSGYKGSIRITGNTCGLGNAHYDQILSERRAKSVRDFLIQKGFNPDHLMARGLGKSHPKFKNIPGEGFKNRRVDIEYVTEKSVAKTGFRSEEKTVQTGTRQIATGFKNVASGTKNVMIDSGQKGSPRVIWKTETVNNPPAWIQRALHNNIKHNTNVNTYQTTEGFDAPKNETPILRDDTASAVCGLPVNINVLGNDSDPENGNLEIVNFTNGANGSVTRGSNGTLIYTSNGSGCGDSDSFTYTVEDDAGNTQTATVNITVDSKVEATNETVTVVTGAASINIDALNNDDPDAQYDSIVKEPQNGSVTFSNGQFIYVPELGFAGTDTFIYKVVDAAGNEATAEVTIIVPGQANQAPKATDDQRTTEFNQAVTIDSLSNDTDPENDVLTITDVSNPPKGTAVISGGQIVYTPDASFVGTDTFTYTISDGNGGTSTATETVIVTEPAAQAPVANNDSGNVVCSGPVTINVLANDTDADSADNALSILDFSQGTNGTVTKNANGELVYTSNGNSCGTNDTFTYTIIDEANNTSNTATVTIAIAPEANTAPEAVDDSITTQVDTAVTLPTVANDSDADGDDLIITEVSNPQNGSVTNDGKTITYTPDPGFVGVDVFDYTITDGNSGSSMATETVTVTAAPNTKPVAKDDNATTQEGTPVTLMTVANDTDADGDDLTISIVNPPQNGTVTNDGKKITYTPNAGFVGVDVFDYSITDGNGGTATATETITVTAAPNTKPVAKDDSATTQVGTPVTLMTVANDTDADGDDLTISIVNPPQSGTVTNDGKKITYTPNAGFVGVDVFDYTITDGNGGTASATETITVTAAPNTNPVAKDDNATTQEGTPVILMTVANDSDVDGDNLTISIVSAPQNGTVTNDGKKITYTPNAGFVGVDVFDYTITDGNGGTATATETITVTAAPNTKPVAKGDSATTPEATPVTLMTVANDTDADGDDLTITNVQQPQNGSVTHDGKKITYTPKAGFIGMDSFNYTIQDGNGGTATATETVVVEAIPNKAPTANLDTMSSGCAVITIDALANDTDPENDQLSIVSVSGASLGTASVVGNKIQFTPSNTCDKNTNGLVNLSYTISDGNNNTATGNINIDLVGEDVFIKAENDRVTIGVDQTVQINVLANDTGLGIKIVAVDTPLNGQLTFTNNVITYTPNPGYEGQDDFFYDIVDQNGNDYSAQVIVDVVSSGKNN